MYIKNIMIYVFVFVVPINIYAKTLKEETLFFVESMSLDEDHTKYYAIYDANLKPSKNMKSIESKYSIQGGANYLPYSNSILPILDKSLGALGYIKTTDKVFKDKVFNEKSLFPIVISLTYFSKEDPTEIYSILCLHIEARSYFIPNHKPYQLTFSDYSKYNKAYPDSNLLTLPLWSTTISRVSNHNPQEKELNLTSMIKCVTPYLNKNFKGTITCRR